MTRRRVVIGLGVVGLVAIAVLAVLLWPRSRGPAQVERDPAHRVVRPAVRTGAAERGATVETVVIMTDLTMPER